MLQEEQAQAEKQAALDAEREALGKNAVLGAGNTKDGKEPYWIGDPT